MFASLEAYAHQLVEFVRVHEAWAAPVVFALAFGESLAFISLLIPAWAALVGIGVLIGSGDLNFWPVWVAGRARRRLRRLAVVLDRPQARTTGCSHVAAVAPSRPAAEGRSIREALGRDGDLHRPLLRTAARVGPAGRRHLPHAICAVSDRELHVRFRVGRGAAHLGRLDARNSCSGFGDRALSRRRTVASIR